MKNRSLRFQMYSFEEIFLLIEQCRSKIRLHVLLSDLDLYWLRKVLISLSDSTQQDNGSSGCFSELGWLLHCFMVENPSPLHEKQDS